MSRELDVDEHPELKSWRCTCGHPLTRHAYVRQWQTSGHPYKSGSCEVDGCYCFAGVSERDAAGVGPPPLRI